MSLARLLCVFALLAALTTDQALASGFQLNEHGARAMGQGGAFAARANDLSALYFNPAGLAYQKGLGTYVGGAMILPRSSYTDTLSKTTDMVKQTFVIPSIYVGYGMDNGLAIGVGFYAPFGLGTEWPDGWAGRFLSLKTDLANLTLNPTVAYKVSDCFMVGAGFSFVWSSVKLSKYVTPLVATGKVDLDASAHGASFNVGAIYKPLPQMSIGASYRHSTKIDYEGPAVFSGMGALASFFPGGTGKTTIKTPGQIFAGVSYELSPDVTLEADYQWIGWSTYDTLTIALPDGPVSPYGVLQKTLKSAKIWDDTYMIRIGGEYRHDAMSLRLGFIYDACGQPNATVEPLLPDANRVEATIGVGYAFTENLSVDLAYQIILFSDRTVTGPAKGDLNAFPGTYKSTANLFGLSLGYGF
jgi:long-chain fatty acid transport protein